MIGVLELLSARGVGIFVICFFWRFEFGWLVLLGFVGAEGVDRRWLACVPIM